MLIFYYNDRQRQLKQGLKQKQMIRRTITDPIQSFSKRDHNKKYGHQNSYSQKYEKSLDELKCRKAKPQSELSTPRYTKKAYSSQIIASDSKQKQKSEKEKCMTEGGHSSYKDYCIISERKIFEGYSNIRRQKTVKTQQFQCFSPLPKRYPLIGQAKTQSEIIELKQIMNIEQQKQVQVQKIQRKSEISETSVKTLLEYIQYYLQNKDEKNQLNQQLLTLICQNSIDPIRNKVKSSRNQLEKYQMFCRSKEEMENRAQIKLINNAQQAEKQIKQLNFKILQLISSHSEYRNLNKQLIQKKARLSQSILHQTSTFKQKQKQISQKVANLKQKIKHLRQKISIYSSRTKSIKNLKLKIKDRIQGIKTAKKVEGSFQFMHQQVMKEKSTRSIKTELLSKNKSEGYEYKGMSNRQLVESLFQSMARKQQIIKIAIQSHSQLQKFQTNLKLKQSQNPTNLLTKQSNTLSKSQINFLSQNEAEYKVYSQYLSSTKQYIIFSQILDSLSNSIQSNYNRIKKQNELVKNKTEQCERQIQKYENIEKIRQAEIAEMDKIINNKNKQLGLAQHHRTSFDFLGESLLRAFRKQ